MKTIQIMADGSDQVKRLLRLGGIKFPHKGDWYGVVYNGVELDGSTIVKARRNPHGLLLEGGAR